MPRTMAALASWLDILVEPKQVLWVPFLLQFHQLCVLCWPTTGAYLGLSLVGLEIQVDAAGAVRAHRLREPLDPANFAIAVRRVLPAADRVEHVGGLAMTGCGRILGDPAHRSAVAEKD